MYILYIPSFFQKYENLMHPFYSIYNIFLWIIFYSFYMGVQIEVGELFLSHITPVRVLVKVKEVSVFFSFLSLMELKYYFVAIPTVPGIKFLISG